jgi:hypothetical protein
VELQGPPQERLRTAVDAVASMLARYAGPAALTDLRAPAPVRVAAR